MLHSLNGSLHVGIHSPGMACYYEFYRVIPLSSSFLTVSLLSVYYVYIVIHIVTLVNNFCSHREHFS